MRIYISIPISDLDERKQREKADMIKACLSRQGHTVVNPFEICAGKNPEYIDYLVYDLRALYGCDAIYMCDGWQNSKGCNVERFFATTYGKKILYETNPESDNYYFNR